MLPVRAVFLAAAHRRGDRLVLRLEALIETRILYRISRRDALIFVPLILLLILLPVRQLLLKAVAQA